MKVLTEGHRYLLEDFEPNTVPREPHQIIQFIEKVPVSKGLAREMETLNNGTTNEEVLEMLINRMNYLNGKFPCRENSIAITNLEQALMWLNKRTNDRKKRGVEGKYEL